MRAEAVQAEAALGGGENVEAVQCGVSGGGGHPQGGTVGGPRALQHCARARV